MGAGAVHGQKKAERSGTASLLKMEYAPALPSRTLIRRPGFLFWQGDALNLPGSHQISGTTVKSLADAPNKGKRHG